MFARFISRRLAIVREVAGEFVDDADDRWRLMLAESGTEIKRWVGVAIALGMALVFGCISLLWGAATIIMLAWDTAWRMHAILGVLGFWILGLLFAVMWIVSQLKTAGSAFALSRRVFAEDLAMLRRNLSRPSASDHRSV